MIDLYSGLRKSSLMTSFDEVFLAADWAGAGAVRISGFAAGALGFEAGRGASELPPPQSRPTCSRDAAVADGVWKKESSCACCCCFLTRGFFLGACAEIDTVGLRAHQAIENRLRGRRRVDGQ